MESVMEKIQILIKIFTRVVTAILLISSVYIYFFWGNEKIWSLVDILCLLLIALASALCILPFLSKKEHSKNMTLLFNILYFLQVNIISLLIGFLRQWFSLENIVSLFYFELVIILVYALVMFINYKIDNYEAKKMNEKLKERIGRN